MNLHEECLIKYLLNPLDLFNSTKLLKEYNIALEKSIVGKKFIVKTNNVNYTGA